jgi:iron complex outermembrane recepter protein
VRFAGNSFSSTDPTLGFKYTPIQDVALRGSYGTGFLPPSLAQLAPGPEIPIDDSFNGLTDPRRGNEPVIAYTALTGGNPSLRPEQSKSYSLGLIVTPRALPGLRVSIDWNRILKRDNIEAFGLTQNVLNDELLYPEGLIVRGPPSDGFPVGPIAQFNARPLNSSRQEVEAYDFALAYQWQGALGTFGISSSATRNVRNQREVIATLALPDMVGMIGNNKWVAHAAATWSYRQSSVSWRTHYFDSYYLLSSHAVEIDQGSATIPSQMYHDLAVSHAFAPASASMWLSDVEVQLGIRNVFDKTPPIVTMSPFYSGIGDPRLRNYYLSVRKSFGWN